MEGHCNANDPVFVRQVAIVCCGLHNVCERHPCPFEPGSLPDPSAYVDCCCSVADMSASNHSVCFQLKRHRLLHRIFASCCICLPCKLSCMSAIASRNCVAIVPFPFFHPTLATGVSSPFFFLLHGTSTSSSSPSLSLSATLLDEGLECSGVSASPGSSPNTYVHHQIHSLIQH